MTEEAPRTRSSPGGAPPRRVNVRCVLCGCGEAEVLYRLGDLRVQRCLQCGLAAINPRIPEEDAAGLYEAYFTRGEAAGRAADSDGCKCYGGYIRDVERQRSRPIHLNRVHRRRLATLGALAPGRRLLDVGTAGGFFLLDARARGWSTIGLEISLSAAAYAQSQGLEVLRGTVREAALGEETFDAVSMWDVIEHLHDPVRDLRKVRRALRPGGVLAISTPNFDSVIRTIRGKRWHGFKLDEHLSLFSPHTIGLLLEETGFDPLRLTTTRTDLVRARRLLLRLRDRIPGAAYEALRLGQAAINETVGKLVFLPWEKMLRGDMMEVYARKS
jgi:SAM-dependent methyltransferase